MKGLIVITLGLLMGLGGIVCAMAMVGGVVAAIFVTPWWLLIVPPAAVGTAAAIKGVNWALDY